MDKELKFLTNAQKFMGKKNHKLADVYTVAEN